MLYSEKRKTDYDTIKKVNTWLLYIWVVILIIGYVGLILNLFGVGDDLETHNYLILIFSTIGVFYYNYSLYFKDYTKLKYVSWCILLLGTISFLEGNVLSSVIIITVYNYYIIRLIRTSKYIN